MQDYSIGDLAAQSGVKVPTIRYYEQIGLIAAPPRTEGNQRRYDQPALDRLKFIAHARDMGFSMESLKSMLRLAGHREAPCADVDALVAEHLAEVDARIAQLTRLRTELSGMLSDSHHGTVADCRIVEVLSDHEECGCEH
ncbi:MAG TPA: helix-turn-helix domain-containing protein [Devosia sp.]|jgi:DNA-binding transcriptional MerR regulator